MKQIAKVLDAVKSLVETIDEEITCNYCMIKAERCSYHRARLITEIDRLYAAYKNEEYHGDVQSPDNDGSGLILDEFYPEEEC